MRTRLSICRRKRRFASAADARAAALCAPFLLLPYACDRCGQFHLTSRTKGKRVPTLAISDATAPFTPSAPSEDKEHVGTIVQSVSAALDTNTNG